MAVKGVKKLYTAIPFVPDFSEFCTKVRLDSYPDSREQVRDFFSAAAARLRPKGLYLECAVSRRSGRQVRLGNACFESQVLSDQLEEGQTVYPYLATCGGEADSMIFPSDPLSGYWLDTLKQMALTAALQHLRERIMAAGGFNHLATMNPGSGEIDFWPLEQQTRLFSLFAGSEARIGVRLTASFLMVPNKTVSGIFFDSPGGFETCRLCSREDCPHRSARFEGRVR